MLDRSFFLFFGFVEVEIDAESVLVVGFSEVICIDDSAVSSEDVDDFSLREICG